MPTSGQITAGELARVCAHYDIGEVAAARKLSRGSGASPKVVLETSTGAYLLKRRAPGRDDPTVVAITHEVQIYLAQHGFPTPRLIGTKRGNNSMLQLDGRAYELFTFVQGTPFQRTPDESRHAGATLASLHALLRGLVPMWKPMSGTFHGAAQVLERLSSIPQTLGDPQVRETTRALRALYREAAEEAQRHALDWRPEQLIHADWHPGNMIFSSDGSGDVRAVLDFDAVRLAPPVVDLANGALQFSILRGSRRRAESEQAPDEVDFTRFKAFCQGYHERQGQPLQQGEIQALPWLMVEALVTETAVTVAATGSFGPLDGWDMLRLVLRKGQWIRDRAATMIDAARRSVP
jgi:homoserine kinase type II